MDENSIAELKDKAPGIAETKVWKQVSTEKWGGLYKQPDER